MVRIRSFADLPTDIHYVWHGVNDPANLRRFLASPVLWGELDVNADPAGMRLIVRHDTFDERAQTADESLLYLADVLDDVAAAGKSVKLDFKVGAHWIEEALDMVDQLQLPPSRLWFNGDYADESGGILDDARIEYLARRYPGAVVQVPLNSVPGRLEELDGLRPRLEQLMRLGVNRWSVGWRYPEPARIVAQLRAWGYDANLYGVMDLDEFLAAVAMAPRAVTADFNFPAWGLYGRGSGYQGRWHVFD